MIIALFAALAEGVYVRENTIFHKTNDITTSRGKWLATFVDDLGPFDDFLITLEQDIQNAEAVATVIVERYGTARQAEYQNIFKALREEIKYLKDKRIMITTNFEGYDLLANRHKRSLIPFIGQAASWLFGLVSEGDIKNIRRNVETLATKQDQIIHAVEECISVLNISRLEIKENRGAIIQLVNNVRQLDDKIDILNDTLSKEIAETKHFLDLYTRLDVLVDEIKTMLQGAMFYLQNLKQRIDFLTLKKVSPGVITPPNLLDVLTDIQIHLPPMLKLIGDPKTELWVFYQYLMSNVLFEGNRMVIVITIPLLQLDDKFEVYKAYNIPLALSNVQTDNLETPDLLATYSLESRGFLIDKGRTKYKLLTDEETRQCSNPNTKWCHAKGAVFPVNLSKLCLINLFLGTKTAVQKYCQTKVNLKTKLPEAHFLFDNQWAIVSHDNLTFTIVCKAGQSEVKTEILNAPMDVLQVPAGCKATNRYLSVTGSYIQSNTVQTRDENKVMLKHLNASMSMLWKPLIQRYPTVKKIKLPKQLKQIKDIPLGTLMGHLSELTKVNIQAESKGWSVWVYVSIALGISLLTLVIGLLIYIKSGGKPTFCSAGKLWRFGRAKLEPKYAAVSVGTELQTLRAEGNVPNAPPEPAERIVKFLYPNLDASTQA